MAAATKRSPYFFDREPDRSVRLRLRFPEEVADLVEEAAGKTPLVQWIQEAVEEAAIRGAAEARNSRPDVRPQ